jgi:ketosteroid isomerase-like protein
VTFDDATEAQRAITRSLFDALNRFDVAAIDELYGEDFILWSPGTLPFSGTHGKVEALELMKMVTSAFPEGLRFTIDAMTVEGERVAVEAHSEGTHASGRDYRNEYHFLVKIRDGKIVMLKEYMDTQHAMDVLLEGMPTPGSEG